MSNNRKMNMKVGQGGLDVDALIMGSDPVSAKSASQAKPKEQKPKKTPVTKKAPWEEVGKGKRKSFLFYFDEDEKMMLDYIRERSDVPTQKFLKRIIAPAIKAEAKALWQSEK